VQAGPFEARRGRMTDGPHANSTTPSEKSTKIDRELGTKPYALQTFSLQSWIVFCFFVNHPIIY
jgi:hypothetical protein